MVLSRVRALLSFLLFAMLAGTALADPPTRVARLAYVSGNASFSPGGERDWGRAIVNRPLTTGDRLWVERGSRAELQMGAVAVRADGGTNITLLNIDDRTTQIQLTRGTLHVRVRRLDRGQIVEINTANLAFSIRRPGSYRIEASPRDDSTTVAVLQGRAQVFGDGRAFLVNERQSFAFYGGGLDDYDVVALRAPNEFDRWAAGRDRRWDTSPSRRYVSVEMIGFEDLDQFGTWSTVADVGPVWVPRRVAADWAPYRDGHWSWVDPWGWTWIDDAPWGFAPSHYGRWMRLDNSWAWVPGPANTRPVYAPAVVAFVGTGSPGAANATVAWFPLGPRDVYRPSYTTSREYFYSLNARVDRQVVSNHYDNRNITVTYSNRQVPGAIIAVPAAAFSQSQPVARVTIRITDQGFRAGAVLAAPPVVPLQISVVGPAAAPAARPPETAPARPIVAQVAPPPPQPSFAAKQGALAANAGKPLDAAAVAAIRPAAPASAAVVKVVPETQAVEVPKAPAAASSAAAERRSRRQRDGDSPGAGAPAATAPAATAPAGAAPASAAPARSATPATPPAAATPAAPGTPAARPAAPASAAASPASAPDAGAAGRPRPREAREEGGRGSDRATPAVPPASAARPTAPAPAAASPASPPAEPGAAGRQRAREAREEEGGRASDRPQPQGRQPDAPAGQRGEQRSGPAAPAVAAPPPAPAAAPAPAPGASAADGSERRRPRPAGAASPAASAASAPADAASEPQRGERRRPRP